MLNSTTYSDIMSKPCVFLAGIFRHPVPFRSIGLSRPMNFDCLTTFYCAWILAAMCS